MRSIVLIFEPITILGIATIARIPAKRSLRLSGRVYEFFIGTIIACIGYCWRVIFSSRLHLLILVTLLTIFLILRLNATTSGILLLTHFNQKQSKRFNRKFIIYGISIFFTIYQFTFIVIMSNIRKESILGDFGSFNLFS